MDANEHVIDLIAAYVLDSLSEAETARVQNHLSSCESCREEVGVYRLLLEDLPDALPQITPPSILRSQLLQSVPISGSRLRTASSTPPSIPHRVSWWQLIQRNRFSALVGLGLILFLAISNILLWGQVNRLQAEIAETDMIVHPLHATELGSVATGLVVMDPHGVYGTIIVDAIPPSLEGQQYQVWLSRGEIVEAGGLFTIRENGYGAQVIYAPEPLNVYERVWITIEPVGGSKQPTGVVVLQTHP
jgi:anti-sigma-K factor RskA